jgi:hypothetical protein
LIESNEEQALACAHAYDENIDDFLEVARKEIAATQ